MKRCACRFATLLIAGLCASLFSYAVEVQPARVETPLPLHWSSKGTDPVADAIQVWQFGPDYFQTNDDQIDSDPEVNVLAFEIKQGPFSRFSYKIKGFLEYPSLRPGVQFSCAIHGAPFEETLVSALSDQDPVTRLQALVVLMRVRSPSSVQKQWDTLQGLKKVDKGARWNTLLKKLEYEFSTPVLKGRIDSLRREFLPTITKEDYCKRAPEIYSWALHAVGATQNAELLPVIKELSAHPHLSTSLDSEASIEKFTGSNAESALAACIKGWQYNACEHAARELRKRNPALYKQTLEEMGPPGDRLYKYAFMLSEIDDARCVPMFCDIMRSSQTTHRGMLSQIERLARLEDLALLKELPEKVPDEDKADTRLMLKRVLQRFQ